MSLKSSNQVATNRYQLEIELPGDVFEKAVEQVYRKENKKITIPASVRARLPVLSWRSSTAARCSMRTPSIPCILLLSRRL